MEGALMQKWEYLIVGGSGTLPRDRESKDYLNQLGDQGWELVSIAVFPVPTEPGTGRAVAPSKVTDSSYSLVFKRPK